MKKHLSVRALEGSDLVRAGEMLGREHYLSEQEVSHQPLEDLRMQKPIPACQGAVASPFFRSLLHDKEGLNNG